MVHSFQHQARDKNSMPPKKGRCRGRDSAKGKGSYSSWNDGSGWNDWGGYDDYSYYSYGSGGKGKGQSTRGTRANAWPKGGKGESRDQFLDLLMWEDSSSHAWTEKEELADLVADKARSDLGIEGEGSCRLHDEGGMENDGQDHVSKSRKLEKRRIHNQKQRANFSAKIESYEDLEARMEHTESLTRGQFDEDPDRAMASAEWEAIAEDSAKEAADV